VTIGDSRKLPQDVADVKRDVAAKAKKVSARSRRASDPALIARLHQLVARAGTIAALATRARVAEASVRHYLGGGEPPCRAIVKLAQAANVSIGWLAAGEEGARLRGTVDPDQLAISIKMVFRELKKQKRETDDPETIAAIVADTYLEWERTGRQPARVFTIVPRRR
jgi:DNA-binding phage protein